MINFSNTPLQSDIAILKFLSQKDDTLLKALDKKNIEQLQDVLHNPQNLQKSNLVPKMVLVHGKNGTYWATRMVNPNDPNNTSSPHGNPVNSVSKQKSSSSSTLVQTPSIKPPGNGMTLRQLFPNKVIALGADFQRRIEAKKAAAKKREEKCQQILDEFKKSADDVTSDNPLIQDVIDNATPEEKALYKATGICAGDEKAKLFVHSILHRMVNPGFEDDEKDITLNTDGKVKAKLSTVSPQEYQQLSQLIEDSWEKREEHINTFQGLGHKYFIQGIYKIEGLSVEADFQDVVKSHNRYSRSTYGGKNGQLDTFFHGTSLTGTAGILGISGQFKILEEAKTGSMLGRAVYLASNSSKSASYIGDHGGFLICEASLGKTIISKGATEYYEGIESQYHAFFADGLDEDELDESLNHGMASLIQPEYAVYDETAVIPRYVVDMRIVGGDPLKPEGKFDGDIEEYDKANEERMLNMI